jgi:precorrin-3B synthase
VAAPFRSSDVDACPGALRLHAAADGPLARVRLPGGMLTGRQLATLAAIAERSGDGHLELTSRANLQLRALTGADPADLAARLTTAGLLPSRTHETVRNIAAPPTAAAPVRTLVTQLDEALCADPALAALPGRFLFAIGETPLTADVAAVPTGPLPAEPLAADPIFAVLLSGEDHGLRVTPAEVVPALLAAAHAFLAERGDRPAWRLHELPDGPSRVAAALGAADRPIGAAEPAPPSGFSATVSRQSDISRNIRHDEPGTLGLGLPVPTAATPVGVAATPVGVVGLGGGLVGVGALVPLGRLSGVQAKVLAMAARVVVTPWRGVLVPDLAPEAAAGWLAALAGVGLEVGADSRWTGVTACAGRPGCAKALADVRADADSTARFVDGLPVHWVGCPRGCGSPAGPHVRVEATPAGYAVTGPSGAAAETGGLAEIVAGARRA